ncbi:hypothetical protein CAPTEDRAFT_222948 [Capitella teleta]|uniref:Endonuclease V n=1 Tax=Capitella teleta TaxID=283909 RepID=X2ATS8_CAPTE|nr:hypothetical protein CAPTEDRAFT_222948 [Capitella teleta]|eukprot:ELU04676.1 hypothetical protein CAPTEDRAFT_222948 [Capitella teleta]
MEAENCSHEEPVECDTESAKGTDEWEVDESIKQNWEKQQAELKNQLILYDVDEWAKLRLSGNNSQGDSRPLKFVGGVDISFVKGDKYNACAAFVVLSYPDLNVVYQDLSMVHLTAPYIPGFLAFREADFLVNKVKKLKRSNPELMPQVIVVDGNGTLHPRGVGLACHLGVELDLPTIGAAKNLYCVDGLKRDEKHFKQCSQWKAFTTGHSSGYDVNSERHSITMATHIATLKKPGDSFPLIGQSEIQLGVALKTCQDAKNPIFVSPGHKISMETSAWVVQLTSKYRVPEPTRQADQLSREYLRKNRKDST